MKAKEKGTVIDDKQDKIALATIYQGIPEDILLSVAEKETAKEVGKASGLCVKAQSG